MGEDASFEQLLELVGSEGGWQRRLLARTAVAPLLMGLHSLATVVLAATPEHWCALPASLQPFGLTRDEYIPTVPSSPGGRAHLECNMFNLSVTTGGALANGSGLLPCSRWAFDLTQYGRTAAVAWQLVCWRSPLLAFEQSTFMLAVLVGFLASGVLSDLFGRRRLAVCYSLLTAAASLAVAAAPSFAAFAALRAMLALLLPGLFSCLMVLCLETVGPGARGLYGILFQMPFALGLMLTAAAAYLTSSWWQLQLVLSVPAVLLPLLVASLPESPRWLLGRGRLPAAADVLQAMAAGNGRPAPARERLLRLLEACHHSERAALLGRPAKAPRNWLAAAGGDLAQLVATPRLRRISLACFWCLFVDGLASYGIAEDAAHLGGDAYRALLLSGAVELLADVVAAALSGAFGRRPTVAAAQLATALPCLTLLAVPAGWPRLALAMAARCAVAAGLNVLAFYSAELFPTSLRSTGFGAGATASRLGAVVAPLVVGAAVKGYWGAPSLVFGTCALGAVLAALLLPETRGRRLPETVEDVEEAH